jgi:hypothetical protein
MPDIVTKKTGGLAVVVGHVLVFVLVFLDPAAGVATATAGLGNVVFFLGLPALGVLAGLYATVEGSFSAFGLFVFSNYLAILGVGLSLLTLTPLHITLVGVVLFGLAGFAAVASLRALWSYLQLDGRVDI